MLSVPRRKNWLFIGGRKAQFKENGSLVKRDGMG